MVMVKPAVPYLDVVAGSASARSTLPLAAYQVRGEYAMHRGGGRARLDRLRPRDDGVADRRSAAPAPT